MRRKGGGVLATVNSLSVSGQKGKWSDKDFGQSKKTKDFTVQGDKLKSEETMFVKFDGEKFFMRALEDAMKGNIKKLCCQEPT